MQNIKQDFIKNEYRRVFSNDVFIFIIHFKNSSRVNDPYELIFCYFDRLYGRKSYIDLRHRSESLQLHSMGLTKICINF